MAAWAWCQASRKESAEFSKSLRGLKSTLGSIQSPLLSNLATVRLGSSWPESRMCDLSAYSKKLSAPAPMTAKAPIQCPFSASTPAPMSPIWLFRYHTAQKARFASCSNLGSPVRRLSTVNSSTRDPAPALQVSVISGGPPLVPGTPGSVSCSGELV